MGALSIPPQGLTLRHNSKHSTEDKRPSEPSQVIRLDLVETVTKEILRSLKNNEQVKLRCGKRPLVQFGKKALPLKSSVDAFPSEIFTKPADDSNLLYFSGKSSHRLEVQKAVEDTAKSDEALATLENTLKSIQEQRASNETSIIGGKGDLKHVGRKDNRPSPLLAPGSTLRKDLLGGLSTSRPSSPFLSASFSPRLGPTSTPLVPGVSAKDRVRLDAVRIPLVHLLAIRPMTLKEISEQLHAAKDDCERLIDKVARDSKAGDEMKELKEKTYRELDVWKFPYRSQEDRQKAIDHAVQAYDRMRVEKKDILWQLLLPQDERGKGKSLSRLNFDKPVAPKSERLADNGNESKAELSDRELGKTKVKKDDTVVVQKKAKDKLNSTKSRPKGDTAEEIRGKNTPQPQSKVARPDGKFKSSERIEDSDEEADAVEVAVAKPIHTKTSTTNRKPDQDNARTPKPSHVILSPRKAVHKASDSSSSSSGNEQVRSALANTSQSLKPQPKSESTASRISPRPRHDSSPSKPSPLGSSPPTTFTDLDNSSSSKASNQSSAPSSPPSSIDMPKRKQGTKYSPVVPDKSQSVSRGRSPDKSPAKRKVAPTDEERPAKRQQPDSARLTPVPNVTAEQLKRPAPVRAESEMSTSPEKPGPNRHDIIQDAKRFHKYYQRYKDLYERISQMDEKERDDKDMNDLWKMHKRLKEMKADIWNNWGKVEKADRKVVNAVRELVAV
ncbi:hypothetical protein H2202_001950 [Exophiala xenobiotica]|nr:hypothetical protein H2202_001950 [Exophiala xenobiotica]KAK5210192.1 hypothetical protein LTR41_003860 [Exophiala xenobiotica]KAK5238339.1 hypothetical protein LTR47_000082 [Exophiala xenobiotica]KAK5261256.1 hypothetical protein LTR40_002563 [Exophiala xenobiotica]KAK5349935.1 hypothetical protein LTR61_006641 [Exophiala xenobiotica]